MGVKDKPNNVTATLNVVVTGEFYDDDATEETLRYSVEQDLEDAGFEVAVSLLKDQEIGHWIFLTDCSNSGVYCSECNTKVFDSYPFKKKLSYFCPHCGTRMEGNIERQ